MKLCLDKVPQFASQGVDGTSLKLEDLEEIRGWGATRAGI